MNQEHQDIQTRFRKGRGTTVQIANISWIIEKQENSRKISASLTMLKPLTMWIRANWKILRDGNNRPPYLSPENPVYAGQEAAV